MLVTCVNPWYFANFKDFELRTMDHCPKQLSTEFHASPRSTSNCLWHLKMQQCWVWQFPHSSNSIAQWVGNYSASTRTCQWEPLAMVLVLNLARSIWHYGELQSVPPTCFGHIIVPFLLFCQSEPCHYIIYIVPHCISQCIYLCDFLLSNLRIHFGLLKDNVSSGAMVELCRKFLNSLAFVFYTITLCI